MQIETWRMIRIVCTLAGAGFIAWMLWQFAIDRSLAKFDFAATGFAQSIAIAVVANAIVGVAFSDMVAKSADVDFGKRLSAYYFSQIAKYVPGRVVALLVQRTILAGPRAMTVTLVSNLELMVVSGWLCTAAALALIAAMQNIAIGLSVGAAGLCIGVGLLRLNWLRIFERARRLLMRDPSASTVVDGVASISLPRAWVLSGAILLLPAASYYVLLANGIRVPVDFVVPLSAMLLLSWVAGMLAVVFPAGIGVRELVFLTLGSTLSRAPDNDLFAAVALSARLSQVLADIAGVALFFAATWVLRRVRRSS